MSIYIDTSAFYAMLCVNDINHPDAKPKWEMLINQDEQLVCTNYVLIETIALVQKRLGIVAVRAFQQDAVPFLNIEWVSELMHNSAMSNLITARSRQLSLVDIISFDVMRQRGIRTAFAYDTHFVEQGFDCL